jgi:hypothetical protein
MQLARRTPVRREALVEMSPQDKPKQNWARTGHFDNGYQFLHSFAS